MSNNETAIAQLETALAASNENCNGDAYWMAKQRCPELVLKESPPQQYLDYCSGNATQAAERLAQYWGKRYRVFQDQAFAPLAQAMQAEEKKLLQTGFSALIQQGGRLLLIQDQSRANLDDYEPRTKLRALFFFLHSVSLTCYKVGCNSVTMIVKWKGEMNLTNFPPKQQDEMLDTRLCFGNQEYMPFVTQLVCKGLCYRHSQLHMVRVGKSGFFLSTLVPAIVQRLSKRCMSTPILAHAGELAQVLESLREHGISTLPSTLGGSWTYERDHVAWLEAQNIKVPPPAAMLKDKGSCQVQKSKTREEGAEFFDTLEQQTDDAMSLSSGVLSSFPVDDSADFWDCEQLTEQVKRMEALPMLLPPLPTGGVLLDDVFASASAKLHAKELAEAIPAPPPLPADDSLAEFSCPYDNKDILAAAGDIDTIAGAVPTTAATTDDSSTAFSSSARSSSPDTASLVTNVSTPATNWLENAIQHVADAEAYRRAVRDNPQLVEKESPPAQFLSFCGGRTLDAAKRIASYWKFRLDIFGDTGAFVPLASHLSGKELAMAQQGVAVVLSEPDTYGRPTLVVDHARSEPELLPEAYRSRELFFVFQCLSKMCYERGMHEFVVIFRWTLLAHKSLQKATIPFMEQVLAQAFCLRPAQFNIAATLEEGDGRQRRFWSTLVPVIIRRLTEHQPQEVCPAIVHAGSQGRMLASLAEHGFVREHLPKTLGGDWCYELDWKPWLQRQAHGAVQADERGRSFVNSDAVSEQGKTMSSGASSGSDGANEVVPRSQGAAHRRESLEWDGSFAQSRRRLSDDAEALRLHVRRQNVIYSRRKRAKEKGQLNELRASKERLEAQNSILRREQASLKQLTEQAQLLVQNTRQARHEGDQWQMPVSSPVSQYLDSLRRRQEVLTHYASRPRRNRSLRTRTSSSHHDANLCLHRVDLGMDP